MSTAPALPRPAAWHRAFRDLTNVHGYRPLQVKGRIPEELRGVLYRTGPATFTQPNGRPYSHWFDGDGAVSAVRFGPAGVEGAVKFVESEGRQREQQTGKTLYGTYATQAGGVLSRVSGKAKASGNTNVIAWQGRVFALMEGSVPVELSPEDLSTIGETDLGVLGRAFSAHAHRVPSRKASYNFSMKMGRETALELFVLPDEGPARKLGEVPLPGPTMIHDFIATEKYLIFFVPPLRARIFRFLLGLDSFSSSLQWLPEQGTEVLVIPIDAPEQYSRLTVPPFFLWHFANAFERGNELVVDYSRQADFSSNVFLGALPQGGIDGAYQSTLHRAVIDLEKKTFRSDELAPRSCEFPRVSASAIATEYRHVYAGSWSDASAGRGLPDQLSRFDVRTGEEIQLALGAECFPSEPVFVRRAGAKEENDGWIVAHVYDGRADETRVVVIDARDFGAGPIAEASFGHALPFTFHGNFDRAR
ncbi:MAG: carotenoid oxygenase family protein [Myxococcaceae bacterium]